MVVVSSVKRPSHCQIAAHTFAATDYKTFVCATEGAADEILAPRVPGVFLYGVPACNLDQLCLSINLVNEEESGILANADGCRPGLELHFVFEIARNEIVDVDAALLIHRN